MAIPGTRIQPSTGRVSGSRPQPHASLSQPGRAEGIADGVRKALRRLEAGRFVEGAAGGPEKKAAPPETINLFALCDGLSHAVHRDAEGALSLVLGDTRGGILLSLRLIDPGAALLVGAAAHAAGEEINRIRDERIKANPMPWEKTP